MLAIILLVLAIVVATYIFIVRPILKTQPAFSEAFKAEASFFDKMRAKVVGWRTRIAARLTMIAGLFVGFYDQALPIITGQDWTTDGENSCMGIAGRYGRCGPVVRIFAPDHS